MSDYAPSFVGFVDRDGKLTIDRSAQFKAYVKHFAGEEVEVEVRKRRSKRSNAQNRLWWGQILPPLCETTGYTKDEMHEALKHLFLSKEDLTLGLTRVGSTRKLNTAEFTELVDRVVLWAAEHLGVVIEMPEESKPAQKPRGQVA